MKKRALFTQPADASAYAAARSLAQTYGHLTQ